jgi:hypothetical protein
VTEEKARHYARTLAEGMVITFYVVRSRDGRFLPVQLPSDEFDPSRQLPHPAACTINA